MRCGLLYGKRIAVEMWQKDRDEEILEMLYLGKVAKRAREVVEMLSLKLLAIFT